MAEQNKLMRLRLKVGATVADDELLRMYLSDAETALLNRLYPLDGSKTTVPERYVTRQIEIAAYLFNKRGAEGETDHTENGLKRVYESASIPPSMLSDIIPYAGVI